MTLIPDDTYWTVSLTFAPYPVDDDEFDDVCDRLFTLTASVIRGVIGAALTVTYCIDGGSWDDTFLQARQHARDLMPHHELLAVNIQRGGLEDVTF